jgi:hypothetical protein
LFTTRTCHHSFVPAPATDLLADLAHVLAALELRWFLFGAQAVVIYGRPRFTEDVDVTVELGEVSTAELVANLKSSGFVLSEFADEEFVAATRVLPFTHEPSGMALDVVISGPGLEQLFIDEAVMTTIESLEVPVIRAEHLVVTKILAGRPKDLEDVAEILAARASELDLDVVRGLLHDLEEALGQSDLLPVLGRLLERSS